MAVYSVCKAVQVGTEEPSLVSLDTLYLVLLSCFSWGTYVWIVWLAFLNY